MPITHATCQMCGNVRERADLAAGPYGRPEHITGLCKDCAKDKPQMFKRLRGELADAGPAVEG